jgi:hypothetical protein
VAQKIPESPAVPAEKNQQAWSPPRSPGSLAEELLPSAMELLDSVEELPALEVAPCSPKRPFLSAQELAPLVVELAPDSVRQQGEIADRARAPVSAPALVSTHPPALLNSILPERPFSPPQE